MKLYKTIILTICAFALFVCSYTSTFASTYTPSAWAKEIVALAESYKIIPENTNTLEYTKDITRSEFCHYAITMYNIFTDTQMPDNLKSHFSDTNDKHVLYAADLGIITGRGEGIFSPDDAITRQEMSVIISRLLSICKIDTNVSEADVARELGTYIDADTIQNWAINPFVFCIKNNLIKGMSENELCPNYHTTREQAIVIMYRCFDNFALEDIKGNIEITKTLTADGDYENLSASVWGGASLVSYSDRSLDIKFTPKKGVSRYKIDIWLDCANFWHADEDIYVKTLYSDTNSFTFENIRIGKQYKINIFDDSTDTIISSASAYVKPLYSLEEKENIVFSHGELESKEAADSVMEQIEVDVWQMKQNGQKYQSKIKLTVHKSIANITKLAFEEIFESKSCFPIKDVGAYSWRDSMSSGRYSHHNYGTAIDINYNENYCLYKDGSFVGQGWLPGENEYSIAADSDVVSIFSKYGFIWGGDEWSNPKDYMHFSFLEL